MVATTRDKNGTSPRLPSPGGPVRVRRLAPAKTDDTSHFIDAYRAFWEGTLPEKRIEQECRSIGSVYHA